MSVSWDTVFQIGGRLADSILLRPRLLSAGPHGPVVFDYGDDAVKSFDAAGRLRWRFGRHGEGPGEFGNPFNIAVGVDGDVWVADVDLGRITILSADGSLKRMLRPDAQLITGVVPQTDGAKVVTTSVERFWIHIDKDGTVNGSGALPSLMPRSGHPFTRHALATASPDGKHWAAAFVYGNALVVYERGELRCSGALIEGEPAPTQPGPDLPIWVAGIAMTDTAVVTLPRGRTRDALTMLDFYSGNDCRYLATLRLPQRILAIAYADDTFFVEHEDPAPGLVALRVRP